MSRSSRKKNLFSSFQTLIPTVRFPCPLGVGFVHQITDTRQQHNDTLYLVWLNDINAFLLRILHDNIGGRQRLQMMIDLSCRPETASLLSHCG